MFRRAVRIGVVLPVSACIVASGCSDAEPGPADARTAVYDAALAEDAAVDAAVQVEAHTPDASLDAASDAAPLDAAVDAAVTDSSARDASARDAAAGDAGPLLTCSVTAPTSCPTPAPRYADLVPIFAARCTVCHGQMADGPWPLDTYGHVADWADDIRAELVACTMPPEDAGIPMTNEERKQILDWLRCGLPR